MVDVSGDRLMIELAGTEEKIEAMLELLTPYGILELARTGVIAMPRGNKSPMRRRVIQAIAQDAGGGSQVDDSALPPG